MEERRKEKRKERKEGKCKQCLCLEVLLFIDRGKNNKIKGKMSRVMQKHKAGKNIPV